MKVERKSVLGNVLIRSDNRADLDAIQRALEQPHILKSLHTLGVALLLDDKMRQKKTPLGKTTFSVRIDHEDAMPVVVHLVNE